MLIDFLQVLSKIQNYRSISKTHFQITNSGENKIIIICHAESKESLINVITINDMVRIRDIGENAGYIVEFKCKSGNIFR